MDDFSFLHQHDLFWLFLGLASFVTGFIASIGGAGGLIIMPFMIGSGIPPQVAVGTAKFSSFGMWAIVLMSFNKAKLISWQYALPMSVLGAIGGIIGANIALSIDQTTMLFTIGLLFLCIGILSIINTDYGIVERETTRKKIIIGMILYFGVITFSGFFPGGMSIFIIFTLISFFGLNALQAHATDIFPWIIQTITSTAVYFMNDMVDLSLALSLFIGLALGGHVGSKIAIKKGARLVKLLISTLAIIMGLYWTIKYGQVLLIHD